MPDARPRTRHGIPRPTIVRRDTYCVHFDLDQVGWKSFQDLCSTVTERLYGVATSALSYGPDEGRDGSGIVTVRSAIRPPALRSSEQAPRRPLTSGPRGGTCRRRSPSPLPPSFRHIAVKVASENVNGFTHLECLPVVIVDEPSATTDDPR
jgi:hypothetical protein